MKCLVVADIHYALRQFDWVLKQADQYEVVIIAGDLLDLAGMAPRHVQLIAVLKYLKRIAARTRLIASSGNHDLDDHLPGGEGIADWLQIARRNGAYIDGDTFEREDARFTVCPWWDGPALRGQVGLQIERDAVDRPKHWIWVYHAPPINSPVSFTRHGSGGDEFLTELIQTHKPDIVLCGHIHESPFYAGGSWFDRIGDTWVFNAGKQIGGEPTRIVLDTTAWTAQWSSLEGIGLLDMSKPLADAKQ